MGKGGGGDTTTVQRADPWSGVQPFLLGSQTRRLRQGVQPTYTHGQTWNPNLGGVTGVTETPPGGWETSNVMSNPDSDYETVGSPGIYPEAQRLYQQQGWSNSMQSLTDAQRQLVAGRTPWQADQARGVRRGLMQGDFDVNMQRVGNIAGVGYTPTAGADAIGPILGVNNVTSRDVMSLLTSPTGARATQGSLDPSSALGQLLSGTVSNPYLDQQAAAITNRLTQNLNEGVMPGIRSSALAAGQYGGSRQGIAEGLAASRLNEDLAPALSQIYGNAHEAAQQRMYGTAQSLNEQALANEQANANRDLTAQTTNAGNSLQASLANASNQLSAQQFNANLGLQNNAQNLQNQQFNANLGLQNNAQNLQARQFNANLGLQNNQQALQSVQQQLANRMQGLNLSQAINQINDSGYAQQLGLLNAPNDYNWQNLMRYAGIIQPGSGIGSNTTTTQQGGSNPFADVLGAGMTGLGLYNGLSGMGLLGGGAAAASAIPMAALGTGLSAEAAMLGLTLSDRRLKRNIVRVGATPRGTPLYEFEYIWSPRKHIGVMADEAPAAAVHTHSSGYLMVDYSKV